MTTISAVIASGAKESRCCRPGTKCQVHTTSRECVVLDVRPYREYAVNHIPGANSLRMLVPSRGCRCRSISRILPKSAGCSTTTRQPLSCSTMARLAAIKRVSSELIEAGYANVRRYQLGIPVWRALGGHHANRTGRCLVCPRQRPYCSFHRRARPRGLCGANPPRGAAIYPARGSRPRRIRARSRPPRTMGACLWKTTTPHHSLSDGTRHRRRQSPRPLRRKRFTTLRSTAAHSTALRSGLWPNRKLARGARGLDVMDLMAKAYARPRWPSWAPRPECRS
jgi:rhodanese-related sulfurtransferase